MKTSQKLKVKKRIPNLNSLEAAICNVALFKTMKEKDFKDTIFISYCQDGVILEAQNQNQWNKANDCIATFIKNKKIQLLTFGYEREVYDNLINGQLKQYTKKLKDKGYDDPYPYINLIHYQRLRKSCEFMSKSKYNAPLAQWERKNKQTPNFAFLVVQPKQRFQQVKRSILGMLKGNNTPILHIQMQPKRFLQLYYNSQNSTMLQSLYEKKQLQVRAQEGMLLLTIYGEIQICQSKVRVQTFSKKLHQLKFQIIKKQQIKKNIQLLKQLVKDSIFEDMNYEYEQKYEDEYCFIVYSSADEKLLEKQLAGVSNKPIDAETLVQSILKYKMCEYSQITFIEPLSNTKLNLYESQTSSLQQFQGQRSRFQEQQKQRHLCPVLINGCQFLLQQFCIDSNQQLDAFLLYIKEYQRCSNSYLLNFYGICVQNHKYYTILEYKSRSIFSMQENGQLVDEIQVCYIFLQILYLINYLHTQEIPRCFGRIQTRQIFFPIATTLPFLYDLEQYSVQNDVKEVGRLMKRMIKSPDEEIEKLICKMTESHPYDRIKIDEAISKLQAIVC